jgi:hypothetical protein
MVVSNDSFDHLPLGFIACTLFVIGCLMFDIAQGHYPYPLPIGLPFHFISYEGHLTS